MKLLTKNKTMKCPNCNVNLLITDRNNVEIDYCPECRGVWLDRGELDKIIERSSQPISNAQSYESRVDEGRNDYRNKGKKNSFLGELFDF